MSTTTQHSLPGAWKQCAVMTAVPGALVVMTVAIAIDTTVVITVGIEVLPADVYRVIITC